MQTGSTISAVGHAALIVLAVVGLPWFGPRERAPIRVTEVSFISEAEFDAAQSAAPAEAPRAEEAPAVLPAPRPPKAAEAPAEPPADAAPEEPEAAPEAPEQAVAVLEPPADPEPGRITPRIVTLDPPTAAAPPSSPAPRVEPNPTPPPPEALPPADTPAPVTTPEPEAEAAEPEPAAAPPEAAPDPAAEAAPRAPLAPETSGRPLARRAIEPPEPEPSEPSQADAVMAAVQEQARRAAATPPTPPTPATPTEPSAPAATSLPAGPPLTSSEKNGLRLAVQRCWNVPAGLRDAQELKVTLAAELAPSGDVITASIRLLEPSPAPDGRFRQAFEAGRRALIRCAPYSDLPRNKFAQWQNIEVVFNPEGMVSW